MAKLLYPIYKLLVENKDKLNLVSIIWCDTYIQTVDDTKNESIITIEEP